GPLLGVWVVPGSVNVGITVGLDRVVARRTLPWAHRVGVAVTKEVAIDGAGWEVLITLDLDGLVRLRKDRPVPHCSVVDSRFTHGSTLSVSMGIRLHSHGAYGWRQRRHQVFHSRLVAAV